MIQLHLTFALPKAQTNFPWSPVASSAVSGPDLIVYCPGWRLTICGFSMLALENCKAVLHQLQKHSGNLFARKPRAFRLSRGLEAVVGSRSHSPGLTQRQKISHAALLALARSQRPTFPLSGSSSQLSLNILHLPIIITCCSAPILLG